MFFNSKYNIFPTYLSWNFKFNCEKPRISYFWNTELCYFLLFSELWLSAPSNIIFEKRFFNFIFSGHWKEAHGDEVLPFKCDECDVRKHSKATLISHKKKWHKPRKMQKCDMCDFQVNVDFSTWNQQNSNFTNFFLIFRLITQQLWPVTWDVFI